MRTKIFLKEGLSMFLHFCLFYLATCMVNHWVIAYKIAGSIIEM